MTALALSGMSSDSSCGQRRYVQEHCWDLFGSVLRLRTALGLRHKLVELVVAACDVCCPPLLLLLCNVLCQRQDLRCVTVLSCASRLHTESTERQTMESFTLRSSAVAMGFQNSVDGFIPALQA